jgi:hypothetical protein
LTIIVPVKIAEPWDGFTWATPPPLGAHTSAAESMAGVSSQPATPQNDGVVQLTCQVHDTGCCDVHEATPDGRRARGVCSKVCQMR